MAMQNVMGFSVTFQLMEI